MDSSNSLRAQRLWTTDRSSRSMNPRATANRLASMLSANGNGNHDSALSSEILESPSWIGRWLATCSDLAELERSNPMTDAVIEEIDGRMIRIGEKWLVDYASCNYLGFDLDREIIAAVPEYLERWGTHPSWSRMLGNPMLYPLIEERLSELLGCEDVLVLPTITLIHMSVIPVLAGAGTIFMESNAHKTIYDGCQLATVHGATVKRFLSDDLEELELLLKADNSAPRMICIDGVNSMSGNIADISGYARLARAYDALLYVDDGHGFGVIGERSGDESCPYGNRGNSIVRHFDESYDHIVLVSGLSKSYSSLAAFLTCPPELKRLLKTAAPPYLYSGPSPTASLATTLVGLDVNEKRGDAIRADLWQKTSIVLEALDELGVRTQNQSGFPIVEIPLAR
ncbi:MAG TPA: pyridoxal phosphate-dependent aminotransferase family protein, partial [Gaiellaceae bacterium]